MAQRVYERDLRLQENVGKWPEQIIFIQILVFLFAGKKKYEQSIDHWRRSSRNDGGSDRWQERTRSACI